MQMQAQKEKEKVKEKNQMKFSMFSAQQQIQTKLQNKGKAKQQFIKIGDKQLFTQQPKRNLAHVKSQKKALKIDQEGNVYGENKLGKKIDRQLEMMNDKMLKTDKNKNKNKGDASNKNDDTIVSIDNQSAQICRILSYYLGQYNNSNDKMVSESQNIRICQDWQIDEIIKQVSDTNLGDYILKFPNPDNISKDLKDIYGDPEKVDEQEKNKNYFNIFQAMQFYFQLFDNDTQSKILSQREQIAFVISFYFLKFKNNTQSQDQYLSMHFIKLYNFFKKVENVKLNDYVALRTSPKFYENYQKEARDLYSTEFGKISILNNQQQNQIKLNKNQKKLQKDPIKDKKVQSKIVNLQSRALEQNKIIKNSNDINQKPETVHAKKKFSKNLLDEIYWSQLKMKIHKDLNQYITTEFKTYWKQQRQQEVNNNQVMTKKKKSQDKELIYRCQDHTFSRIISKIKNVSQLIKTFPTLLRQILTKIRMESQQTLILKKRIMFGGQYLKKTIERQNIKWVNTKTRPNDIATLLRFAIIYQLVIKNHLFVRSFLSQDELYIIVIIKIRDQILQNYAQKYKIKLQVQLGATDLFSLQPVDNYMRPLRLHHYLNDTQFIQKYNIKRKEPKKKEKPANKQQQAENLVSIESQAANTYQKVQHMNEDQLRTAIIEDQFQATELYEYVAKLLNIGFIRQKILVNQYNSKNPSRKTWELYFIYNKFIIEYLNRVKGLYQKDKKLYPDYHRQLNSNIGMILRLMFLKALWTCNDLYYNQRQIRSSLPRFMQNWFDTKFKLKNIWHILGVKSPSGFHPYIRKPQNDKMWRKFQINELKDRSKFFPAERLMITNKVITKNINISKALQKFHVLQYYPLHDPYVLQNIQIMPYITNVRKKGKQDKKKQQALLDGKIINKLYSQYQCQYTENDFVKSSLRDKLQLKFNKIVADFSTQSVRYYCGEKIAFYFQFIKYLALKSSNPLYLLIILIAQALLWKQQTDILAVGESYLTPFNNILIVILTFLNIFWVTHLVETWKNQQKRLSQSYGVTQLAEFQEKRVKFQGSFKRNFETDQLNYEYVPKWEAGLKTFFTFFLNIVYLALVIFVILMLFLFKTYLFQSGVQQTVTNILPSILIAVASNIFTQIYNFLIKKVTTFENHKTVSEYQASLISKSSLIGFIIGFFSIFIFAFFSGFINSEYLCAIRTTQTLQTITNCDYFLSSQLMSMVGVELLTTFIGAFFPFIMFKAKQWKKQHWDTKQTKKKTKFNQNFFQSIDQFYEEQDGIDSYMFNEQLDSSWQGYMKIINIFIATALFAPALPLCYFMIFLISSVRLHASKFQIIYYKRRILPIKTNSINWWLFIVEMISFLSILTNVAYMIYTRQLFQQNQARTFFAFIVVCFAIKYYLLTQYGQEKNIMAKRNEIKVNDFLLKRGNDKHDCIPEEINTDIQNVIYNEQKLNRKFHNISAPKIKQK